MIVFSFIVDYLKHYLTNNFILLLALICLIFIFLLELYIGKLEKRYLKLAALAIFLTSVIQCLDHTIYHDYAEMGSPQMLKHITAYLVFIILPLVPMAVFKIVTVEDFNKWFVLVPTLVNFVIMTLSFFSFGPFKINEVGQVVPNNFLFYSNYVFSGLYLVCSIIYVCIKLKHARTEEFLIIITANIAILISGVVEAIFDLDAFVANVSAVSLLIYYIFIIIRCLNRDPLTHCLNRFSYFTDINYYKKKITAIISIDVNDLKVINDVEGHFYGDICLEMVSKAIRSSCPREALCYRIGGDEFSIICNDLTEDKVKLIISDIMDKVHKSSYSVAIGYAMKQNDNEEINALIVRADSQMYINKAEIKDNKPIGSS